MERSTFKLYFVSNCFVVLYKQYIASPLILISLVIQICHHNTISKLQIVFFFLSLNYSNILFPHATSNKINKWQSHEYF